MNLINWENHHFVKKINEYSGKNTAENSNSTAILKELIQTTQENFAEIKKYQHAHGFSSIDQELTCSLLPETLINYTVLGFDSSHYFPSRHDSLVDQALFSFAHTTFEYHENSSSFEKKQKMILLGKKDAAKFGWHEDFDEDFVSTLRHYLELEYAVSEIENYCNKKKPKQLLAVLDGALSTHYLSKKSEHFQDFFMPLFEKLFIKIKALNTPILSYISRPQSCQLTSSLKDFFCKNVYFKKQSCLGQCEQKFCSTLFEINDAIFFDQFDKDLDIKFLYSSLFSCAEELFINSSNTESNIFPFFFYLRTKFETSRVEFFSQCFDTFNENKTFILQALNLEISKGFGFPACLSEAHLAADIRPELKQLFLDTYSIKSQNSQKSISKKILIG